MADFTEQYREKLEILDGSRGKTAKGKAAVRVEDLAALLAIPRMKSSAVTASPTAEDFNALRADLKEVSDRLFVLADVLRERKS